MSRCVCSTSVRTRSGVTRRLAFSYGVVFGFVSEAEERSFLPTDLVGPRQFGFGDGARCRSRGRGMRTRACCASAETIPKSIAHLPACPARTFWLGRSSKGFCSRSGASHSQHFMDCETDACNRMEDNHPSSWKHSGSDSAEPAYRNSDLGSSQG